MQIKRPRGLLEVEHGSGAFGPARVPASPLPPRRRSIYGAASTIAMVLVGLAVVATIATLYYMVANGRFETFVGVTRSHRIDELNKECREQLEKDHPERCDAASGRTWQVIKKEQAAKGARTGEPSSATPEPTGAVPAAPAAPPAPAGSSQSG